MNIYTIYADHTPSTSPRDFVDLMTVFLNKMVELGRLETYRITRMKLGFRSMDLPEFRIDMEFRNLQQLDDAMTSVLHNENQIDDCHVAFNQLVDTDTIQHFLYRDFPDDNH